MPKAFKRTRRLRRFLRGFNFGKLSPNAIKVFQRAGTENTLKEFNRIRRKRQEGLAVYGVYSDRHKTEPISENFRPKPKKNQILNHLCRHMIEWAKKQSHATVPLKPFFLFYSRIALSMYLRPWYIIFVTRRCRDTVCGRTCSNAFRSAG